MSPLRTIARDLVERRLWPLAALLVVGLVAIPVVFLRPSPNALSESATPAAPPAAPSNPAASSAATTAAPTDPTADPSVALTSSPFAAAFAGPLDLPPSMQGLLKATKGSDDRRAVADAPLRDPFAAALESATSPAASTTTSATTSGSSSTPAAASGSSSTQATPSSAAPRAVVQGSRGSAPTQDTTPSSGTSTPSNTPASTPSTPASSDTTSSSTDWHVFRADVSFGNTQTLPTDTDATRLTAYPSLFNPIAIYLGVMRGGWGAVFMLREDVRPIGAPSCRPRKTICSWVILHPGESVTLNAKDAAGNVTPYTLKLAAIREDKVAEAAAKAAYAKANAGGRCLLGALAAYHYDAMTGTLTARPEMKDCRYAGDDATTGTDPAATTPAPAGQASDTPAP